jgi:hypothetical protein
LKPAVCLASLVILLWGVPAPPAWGTEITAGSLLTAEPANLGHTAEGPGLAQPFDLLSRALSIGEADVLAMEMIRDENRSTLDLYTASRETTIPLASAQLYIVHAVRVSQIKRGKVEEVAPLEAPPPPAWLVKQLPTELPSIADIDKFAKLLERHPLPEFKGVRPVDWLFEQDGLFSGRPWSWENFLPRLATVAVIVLGGLFAVEALHALLSLGRRAMGNGGRGKGKS